MALLVLNVVGLTADHLGSDTPHLTALANQGEVCSIQPALPTVTTTAQATMLTGVGPEQHGIVGNGWFFRDLGEILFWRQSEALIQAPPFWHNMRKNGEPLRVLKHFWWYAMNSRYCSHLVTPRPAYHADGRKTPDFYTHPNTLHETLEKAHGPFPLFHFWGPMANQHSSAWIADSFRTACQETQPDLALCYLPHLDYDLQRFGPTGPHLPENLRTIDAICGQLIAFAHGRGDDIVILSEYGLNSVSDAGMPNRWLRQAGLLAVTRNATGELLDPGASRAFAVCDHQVAHIYCHNQHDITDVVKVLRQQPTVSDLYIGQDREKIGLNHSRAGDIVLVAAAGCWFGHDYWPENDLAAQPDFTHLVEIHKKPGYDPRELRFRDGGKWRAARALIRKKLGFRYLMDVISTDPTAIRGSHGRAPHKTNEMPVYISGQSNDKPVDAPLPQTAIAQLLAQRLQAQCR